MKLGLIGIALIGCTPSVVRLDAASVAHLDANTAALNALSERYDIMMSGRTSSPVTEHIVCRNHELHAVESVERADKDLGTMTCPGGRVSDQCTLGGMPIKVAQAKCTLGELK
jgi:hypothetical protein